MPGMFKEQHRSPIWLEQSEQRGWVVGDEIREVKRQAYIGFPRAF